MTALARPLPSVRDVLGLAELTAGAPELVTGEVGLDRGVRWAHVVAGSDAPALLDGGELVLTTGAGWPDAVAAPTAALSALVTALVDADPAAIVFELGSRFTEAPAPLVAACGERGIPLIVLHRVVRFVQITQRVHQRVLAAQNEALEARAEVHAMLTELGLNRSPVDYVVDRIAATLGAPVVLEDAGHRVVAWSGSDAAVLDHWASAQAGAAAGPPLPAGATRVPVEAQGNRWGWLTALDGPAHPAGRETVLELGAFALALARLADAEGETWLDLGSKRLFDAALSGRFSGERELSAQLAAGGLPIDGRALLGATLTGFGDFGAHESLEAAILSTALRRAVAPDGRVLLAPAPAGVAGPRTLLALLSFPPQDPRASAALAPAAHPLAERLAHELAMMLPETTPAGWHAHLSIGVGASRPRALIASLERVAVAGAVPVGAARVRPGGGTAGRVTVQLAEARPLAYLVRGLAGVPELEEFAAVALGPLVEHDAAAGAGHSGDLVRVLAAYLAHPTNRSLAAQRARLSRSVFYQRIALIEELLGVDLADGETIAALTVALLARDRA
ncbi:hypothetical protein ACIFOC_02551 [Leucobacter aridicollis]|uniref:PucR family transcriptional regulator n=1 Tax=Leucobacter aridicollis TaxID=283878 RepID=UPI0037C7E695